MLLLDEPFSALDAMTRTELQDHLLELWKRQQTTMLLVTHDIEEAAAMADRIVVMRPWPGRIFEEVRVSLPHPREQDIPRDIRPQKAPVDLLTASLRSSQQKIYRNSRLFCLHPPRYRRYFSSEAVKINGPSWKRRLFLRCSDQTEVQSKLRRSFARDT